MADSLGVAFDALSARSLRAFGAACAAERREPGGVPRRRSRLPRRCRALDHPSVERSAAALRRRIPALHGGRRAAAREDHVLPAAAAAHARPDTRNTVVRSATGDGGRHAEPRSVAAGDLDPDSVGADVAALRGTGARTRTRTARATDRS